MATRIEQIEGLGMEKYFPDPDLRDAIRVLRGKIKIRDRRMKGLLSGYPKRIKKRKSAGSESSSQIAEDS